LHESISPISLAALQRESNAVFKRAMRLLAAILLFGSIAAMQSPGPSHAGQHLARSLLSGAQASHAAPMVPDLDGEPNASVSHVAPTVPNLSEPTHAAPSVPRVDQPSHASPSVPGAASHAAPALPTLGPSR
jgi:hypothetical protein